MYRKQYRVSGQDVDDFMVMKKIAYRSYTFSILKTFLIENGHCLTKLKQLKNNLEACNEQLTSQKDLMFTQDFSVNLDCFEFSEDQQKTTIKNRFFNAQNELCATLVMEV